MDLKPGCVAPCPGCSHRNLSPQQSAAQKQQWLSNKLSRWASQLADLRAPNEESRWGYRERTCLRAQWNGEFWEFGFRIKKLRQEEFISIPKCPIHAEKVHRVIEEFSNKLPKPPKFPLMFLSISGDLATLVLKTAQLPELSFLNHFDWKALGLHGLWINLNPSAGERVFSSRGWHLVWGAGTGELWIKKSAAIYTAFQNPFHYGPSSFQQVIPELHGEALSIASQFLNPQHGDYILDLCSGIGISMRLWQERGANCLGVELGGEAVQCAEKNLQTHSKALSRILRGRTSERLPQIDSWLKIKSPKTQFSLFANPPRTGLEEKVIHWITDQGRPQKIAYLSCSAGTLARDLALFCKAGYTVQALHPFDFFPNTHHVETLALLYL